MKKEKLTEKEQAKVNELKKNYNLDVKKEVTKYDSFLSSFLLVLGISLLIEIIVSIVLLSVTDDALVSQALVNTLLGINLTFLTVYVILTNTLVSKLVSHFKGHRYVEEAKEKNKINREE